MNDTTPTQPDAADVWEKAFDAYCNGTGEKTAHEWAVVVITAALKAKDDRIAELDEALSHKLVSHPTRDELRGRTQGHPQGPAPTHCPAVRSAPRRPEKSTTMTTKTESITLSQVITEPEFNSLVAYLNCHGTDRPHNHILDWLGTQAAVLARMNEHKLLITYFSLVVEYALIPDTTQQTSRN